MFTGIVWSVLHVYWAITKSSNIDSGPLETVYSMFQNFEKYVQLAFKLTVTLSAALTSLGVATDAAGLDLLQ